MPFICIGPVCIPWAAVAPILMWLARPLWVRLPPRAQAAISTRWEALQARLQASVWDRIGWAAKKPRRAAAKEVELTRGAGSSALLAAADRGTVVGLRTDAEWAAALDATRASGTPLVVDFTAEWCGPCQRIKPDFERLAKQHGAGAVFVKVDVDELEEVSQEAGVLAMPTFQVYRGGKLADTCTGASVAKLEAMVVKAVKSA